MNGDRERRPPGAGGDGRDGPIGIEGKVAAEILIRGEQAQRWAVEGVAPRVVAVPRTADEAADVLGWANELGLTVAVAGAGTRLAGSGLPSAPDLVVTALGIADLIHYEPADMTFSAGAGMTGSALGEITAGNGQTLPLNPPGWTHATLGGLFSRGEAGGSQEMYGRVRDLALGFTLVTGDGKVLRVGGQVVKNVAGFDLVRLAVGGRGALGLLTGVSARLFPLPEREAGVWARFGSDEELLECGEAVRDAPFALAGAEARWAWRGDGAGVFLRLRGNREPVEEMCRFLLERLGTGTSRRMDDSELTSAILESEGADPGGSRGGSRVCLRFNGLPAELAGTLSLARALGGESDLGASLLTGEITVLTEDSPDLEERVRSVAARLWAVGGAVEVLRGPSRIHVAAHRSDPGAQRLGTALQDLFDPDRSLLSGARFEVAGSRADPDVLAPLDRG
jgi:glycolate oxidase FAD binding subunit